jgi:solute carrier family 40 (iron-regulated transporter), member 1
MPEFEELTLEAPAVFNGALLFRFYTSHTLSVWNSRLFEFGAVLFLAIITPGTLFYASTYALIRSLAVILLASRIGDSVDRFDRLTTVRFSIILQRGAVALSCLFFGILASGSRSQAVFVVSFVLLVILSCVEKTGSIVNTIAIERDWIPVISDSLTYDRSVLNATMRRIDLIAKLVAPVAISIIQTFSTLWAIVTTFLFSGCFVVVEYIAIAKVYSNVPELAVKHKSQAPLFSSVSLDWNCERLDTHLGNDVHHSNRALLSTWFAYFKSPAFLASLSLSLLYLTVLSTGVQYQTYMLSIHFTSLEVSLIRVMAVTSELLATCFAPCLIHQIGQVRSGLWSVNWQSLTLAASVAAFAWFGYTTSSASYALTIGIVASRVGLWGFDLAVQDIVQEVSGTVSVHVGHIKEHSQATPTAERGQFSACESALQNFFELLSFAFTILFPDPSQFRYPVYLSLAAVLTSSCCYAAYVRKERGHLIHISTCIKGSTYQHVSQSDYDENQQ